MEIKVERKVKTGISTIGRLTINNIFECYTLEDCDRGLKKSDPLESIVSRKVYGKTAIPSGRYQVIISYSNKYKKEMPLLLNVPGYLGIRIHSGNKAEDTEGCLLLGKSQGHDWIGQSRDAYNAFMTKLKAAAKVEKIYITIE